MTLLRKKNVLSSEKWPSSESTFYIFEKKIFLWKITLIRINGPSYEKWSYLENKFPSFETKIFWWKWSFLENLSFLIFLWKWHFLETLSRKNTLFWKKNSDQMRSDFIKFILISLMFVMVTPPPPFFSSLVSNVTSARYDRRIRTLYSDWLTTFQLIFISIFWRSCLPCSSTTDNPFLLETNCYIASRHLFW